MFGFLSCNKNRYSSQKIQGIKTITTTYNEMAEQPEWEAIEQKMCLKFRQALKELQRVWEDIGCTRETRQMYYEQAHNHINDLLNDMVAESQTKKQLLLDSIKDLLKQTSVLAAELHLEFEPKSYDQIPLSEVEQMLRSEMQDLEHMKEERMMMLKELLAKEEELCKKLGVKKVNITVDVLPTKQELESFKLFLQKQENEKVRLESVFMDIRRHIIRMMDEVDVSPSTSFQQLICENPEEFVLSAHNMTKLREFRDELNVQVEETKGRVEKMKRDLMALWKYLDEPADVCQMFLERYSDYSSNTINALSAEIKRCKESRKENIFKYVTQIRLELMNLWDLCRYCEAERNTFAPFHSNTFTEDLLTLHELEVDRLRKFYNDNQTIFELLEQRENLIMKIKEILQRANNPDRYHNRGGQLLMEEKERKVIQKKLPKIEAELQQLINEYEARHNQVFTIYGTSLENVLAETWESINHEKETIKKARKEAKDKSIKKSPLNSSKKTPGMSHLSIHRGPTPLSKRKLFSPSPNSSIKRRNKNGEKIKPTVSASKIRRSGRIPRSVPQRTHRSPKSGQKRKQSTSPTHSITDTTYNQFQGHMTEREELHSSMLPEQILKSSNRANVNKTPIVRTPMKPLRKNLGVSTTPVGRGSARKAPHSPHRINSTPKLATAPSNLPFIF